MSRLALIARTSVFNRSIDWFIVLVFDWFNPIHYNWQAITMWWYCIVIATLYTCLLLLYRIFLLAVRPTPSLLNRNKNSYHWAFYTIVVVVVATAIRPLKLIQTAFNSNRFIPISFHFKLYSLQRVWNLICVWQFSTKYIQLWNQSIVSE